MFTTEVCNINFTFITDTMLIGMLSYCDLYFLFKIKKMLSTGCQNPRSNQGPLELQSRSPNWAISALITLIFTINTHLELIMWWPLSDEVLACGLMLFPPDWSHLSGLVGALSKIIKLKSWHSHSGNVKMLMQCLPRLFVNSLDWQ